MSSRVVASAKHNDGPTFSEREPNFFNEDPNHRGGTHNGYSLSTSVPPPATAAAATTTTNAAAPRQRGPMPSSPLTTVWAKLPRSRSQRGDSPRRLSASVGGPSHQQQQLQRRCQQEQQSSPAASPRVGCGETARSTSAHHTGSARGSQTGLTASLSVTSPSVLSSAHSVMVDGKPPGSSASLTRRTFTRPPPPHEPSSSASSPLLSTVSPSHGSAVVMDPIHGSLSSTYTPASDHRRDGVRERAGASASLHPAPSGAETDAKIGKEESEELKSSSDNRTISSEEKPWLSVPRGHGILKRRHSPLLRAGAITISSTPTAKGRSLSATAPPAPPSPSTGSSVSHLRLSRHVHFDEANIQYLDASASHVIYSDSQLGVRLNSLEWGAVMMSPEARQGCSGARRADSGTTVSMGMAKPSAWGADSEWFNAEFGEQMEPHADHSDLSSPALLQGSSQSVPSTSWLAPDNRHHPPISQASAAAHADSNDGANTGAAAHAVPPSTTKRSKAHSKAAAGKKTCRKKDKQEPRLRPSTPTVRLQHQDANLTVATAVEENEAEARGSSPVLVYERDPLNTTAGPHQPLWVSSSTSAGAAAVLPSSEWGLNSLNRTAPLSTHSANDDFVPAPPLSVGALRHRLSTSLSSAQTSTSTLPTPQLGTTNATKTSGCRPRLTSPGVSFTNVHFTTLNMDDDFTGVKAGDAAQKKGSSVDRKAPAPPPPPRLQSTSLTNAAEEGSNDLSESPSIASALQLSETERRLLRAVMHVNKQDRSATCAQSSSSSGGGTRVVVGDVAVADANSECSGTRALQAPVRTLAEPCTELLSSGKRRFLNGGKKQRQHQGRERQGDDGGDSRRAPSPSPAVLSRGLRSVGGGSRIQSEPTSRIRVFSTPLRSTASRLDNKSRANERSDNVVAVVAPHSNGTISNVSPPSLSVESPLHLSRRRADSYSSDLSSSRGSLSSTTGAGRYSGPDSICVPTTLATLNARRHHKQECQTGGNGVLHLRNTMLVSLNTSALQPPPQRPPSARKKAEAAKANGDDDDDDDAEPHLCAPVPTPRSGAAGSNTKRRKSL